MTSVPETPSELPFGRWIWLAYLLGIVCIIVWGGDELLLADRYFTVIVSFCNVVLAERLLRHALRRSWERSARTGAIIGYGFVFLAAVACFCFPSVQLLVAANSFLLILLGADAALHFVKGLRALAGRRSRAAGIAVAGIFGIAAVWFWGALAMVLLQMVLAPYVVRYFPRERIDLALERQEEVRIETIDGLALRGTYCPGDPGKPAVLLLHGVGDDRNGMFGFAFQLRMEGYHTLRIDLRAHGESEGSLCTLGAREQRDVTAALKWLAERKEVDGNGIFVLAASLGGAAALNAAMAEPAPHALILLAPLTDVPGSAEHRVRFLGPLDSLAARTLFGMGWMLSGIDVRERSPSERYPTEGAPPVLIFHGDQDTNLPSRFSEEFARRRPALVRYVPLPGVDHVGVGAAVMQSRFTELVDFIEKQR